MDDSCSQSNFTCHLEEDLLTHHKLGHHATLPNISTKIATMARMQQQSHSQPENMDFGQKEIKGLAATSSATRLFCKLRAKICRSRQQLFSHPEERSEQNIKGIVSSSECTSKAMAVEEIRDSVTTCAPDKKESYACHLCDFNADRITVLDRHLLNDHKIGLDNLLKLVLAKTKDSLNEDDSNIFGIRKPYYQPVDDIIEAGEFVIETVSPKIKILRHASTNTEPMENQTILDFRNNYEVITTELERMINLPIEKCEKVEMMEKMKTLNAYMYKLVESSNTVNKVLHKEFDFKRCSNEMMDFHLELGDQESPRNWERSHSEKVGRARSQYGQQFKSDKARSTAESYYF